MGAIILQQNVDKIQAAKLLAEGKTDPLKNFVSKRTNRTASQPGQRQSVFELG